MFEIVFLGTSASAPSVHRGLSAQVVKHEEYRFLIDCGEGTQRQILKSGIGFKRLNRILITHGHLDHILGLGGLMSTLLRWEAMDELEIWAGKWALDRIKDLLNKVVLRGRRPPMPLHYREIQPGTLFEGKDFTISAFPVSHRGADSYGFAFEEHTRRPFLPEKAEALDIPPGPWRRDLVLGQRVTLPDGRAIDPEQVLGEPRLGTRFVHIGDVGDTKGLQDIVRDADGLVMEATYINADAQMARDFGHMTAKAAAEFALDNGVKHLFLNHISRRYRERDVMEEARSIFPNSHVVRDFDAFQVRRDECIQL